MEQPRAQLDLHQKEPPPSLPLSCSPAAGSPPERASSLPPSIEELLHKERPLCLYHEKPRVAEQPLKEPPAPYLYHHRAAPRAA